jgi:cellulose synthase operon protein C
MNVSPLFRGAVAAAVVVAFAGCSSKADRLQSGLDKGAEYVRLADWDKAGIEVRNVLQIDPKNAQAFYIAGQVAEGKREIQKAYGSFAKAVELQPDHLDAKVGVARLQLLVGDAAKAQKAVDEALALSPRHAGALTIQAGLMARSGDVAGAVAKAQALIAEQKAPPVDASMLLAGLQANLGQSEAALATIDAALKADPKHLGLLSVASQLAAAASAPAQQERAVGYLQRATEQAPKNIQLWTAWAGYHVQRKELDRAEAVLRASIKAQPDDSQRTLALLSFLSSQRGFDAAEKGFLAAIKDRPRDSALQFGLVNLYRNADRAPEARAVLEQLAESNKEAPGLAARNQLAADHLARGNGALARTLVGEVLAASPRDNAALILRARMLLAEGDARNAVIDLRAAARDQPGSPEIAGLLAQAHRRAGETQLAREVLAESVNFKPDNPELRLLLAADLADAKDYKSALSEVEAALKAAPGHVRSHEMKARLALAQKDVASAEKVFVSYKTQFPSDASGFVRLGQFYADQKRFDAALKEYDAAARLAPQAPAPAMSAIGLLVSQRRFAEAHQRIDALLARDPNQLIAHQLRGEVAAASGDTDRAQASYRRFIELAPNVASGYHSLARVSAQRGGLPAALGALEQGEKALPDDRSLPAARGELLVRAGRHDEAITLYEGLVKRWPNEDSLANNLAYLLVEHRSDKASHARALELVQRFKDSGRPGYLDTLGWTHYRLGDYPQAVAVLERAVAGTPDAPLLQLHLGLALHKKGDTVRAHEFLKQALASKAALPHLDEARQLLAQR